MSKLLGTYSLGMKTPSKPRTENQELASPTGCGLGKLGRLTMAMLLGLVRPTAGTGSVLGAPIDDPSAYLSRVGALIESPAFYRSLSGA